jgi:hypothetical protein
MREWVDMMCRHGRKFTERMEEITWQRKKEITKWTWPGDALKRTVLVSGQVWASNDATDISYVLPE